MEFNKGNYCRFCGQTVIMEFEYEGSRNREERIKLLCNCPEAKAYQEEYKFEEEMARAREVNLKKAYEDINQLFGNEEDATAAARQSICYMQELSILVYDKLMLKATVELPGNIKAILKMNTKGSLVIERQDKSSMKIEI